jgi:hypothetical protein
MKRNWVNILFILIICLFIIYHNYPITMLFAMTKTMTWFYLYVIMFEHPKSTYYFNV